MPSKEYPSQNHMNALFGQVGESLGFFGSCFYVTHGGKAWVCTAQHVIAGFSGKLIVVSQGKQYPAKLAKEDPERDVAILEPEIQPGPISMSLSSSRQKAGNVPLIAYEYTTTEIKNGAFVLTPASRQGNCVRVVQMEDSFGLAGRDMLELSFPALKGASGAAVVELHAGEMIVHGMMVANAERHLLPAHIEAVLDEDNDIYEERKYFLPQAVAVNSIRIIEVIDALCS